MPLADSTDPDVRDVLANAAAEWRRTAELAGQLDLAGIARAIADGHDRFPIVHLIARGVDAYLHDWHVVYGDGAKASRKGGTTSRSGARVVRSGTARADVLCRLSHAPYGLTTAEIADARGEARNQTAARVLELREAGFVEARVDGDGNRVTRTTSHGRDRSASGTVWAVTYAGRLLARTLAPR